MANLFKMGTGGKGKRTRREARGDWFCKIRLAPYQQRRARLCTDAAVSESWAQLLQAGIDRKNAGEPPTAEMTKQLPRRLLESFGLVSALSKKRRGTYADNVDDYIRELETARRDSSYVRITKGWLAIFGDACGWRRLADIDRDSVAEFLASRQADGRAPRTLNNMLATLKGFARWCVEAKRLDANPCEHIKRVDQTGDLRRRRRALTHAECVKLLRAAGPRATVYRVGLGTGLRKREIARLQWQDVRLNDPARPCIMLRVEATKSKRADVLPLSGELAACLRALHPADCKPTDPVFATMPGSDTWLRDLKAAGITYRADDGTIAGFHSLRVTYITELQKAGLPPRTVMQLARHTDYRLTASIYTDMRLIDTFGAVNVLPTFGETDDLGSALRTGTDDLPIARDRADQIRDQMGRFTKRRNARLCSKTDSSGDRTDDRHATRNAVACRKNGDFRAPHRAKKKAEVTRLSPPRVGLEPTT